jgi:ubiquinone/menaquinone biosynthesis C-methylase UbiE
MPFSDGSFDTVVDTFGLECAYDVQRQFNEMKRMTKPGGKILLLERGKGFWLFDNFKLMLKLSVNMSARAQFYHHDFSKLVENDPEVKVVKKLRHRRGMVYSYELQKL